MKKDLLIRIVPIFLVLFLFTSNTVKAQKTFSNSVKVHTGTFYIKDRYQSKRLTRFVGVYGSRKVYSNFWVSGGYSQWYLWGSPRPLEIAEPLLLSDTAYGTLMSRIGFKMVDVSGLYRLNIYKNKHSINVGVGISYCWGTNVRIEQKKYPIIIGYDDTYRVFTEKERYWGAVPQLSYDFSFVKNRVNVGVDLRGRYYRGIAHNQYDIGLHIGVNF